MAHNVSAPAPFAMEWSMPVPLAPEDAWTSLHDEVRLCEVAAGLIWPGDDHGPLLVHEEDGTSCDTGRSVEVWPEDMRLRFRSEPQGWAQGAESIVDIAVIPKGDAECLVVLRADGWAPMIEPFSGGDMREMLGFAIGRALVPLARAVSQSSMGDWLSARLAGKPQGLAARSTYAAPEMHMEGFRSILNHLRLKPDDRLLEIGFGGGYLLHEALRSGCSAIGIDHSPEMVRLATEQNHEPIKSGRLTLIQADAERPLSLLDDAVTAVAMATVFFFFQRPVAVLKECHRVLRSGGRLAVFTIPPEFRGTPASPEPMGSRGHHYHDEELAALAQAAGFVDVAVRRAENGGQILTART